MASTDSNDDDLSLAALESEIEQTADTLEILERIASLQLQQLERQRTQTLATFAASSSASWSRSPSWWPGWRRAEPRQRTLILLWTLVACVVAGAATPSSALGNPRTTRTQASSTGATDAGPAVGTLASSAVRALPGLRSGVRDRQQGDPSVVSHGWSRRWVVAVRAARRAHLVARWQRKRKAGVGGIQPSWMAMPWSSRTAQCSVTSPSTVRWKWA